MINALFRENDVPACFFQPGIRRAGLGRGAFGDVRIDEQPRENDQRYDDKIHSMPHVHKLLVPVHPLLAE
jgi:hypothetical protein